MTDTPGENNAPSRHEQVAASLETLPLALVVGEADGATVRVVDWNAAAERTFGWAREEVLGRDMLAFLPADEIKPALRDVAAALHAERSPHTLRYTCNTRGGGRVHIRWFSVSVGVPGTNKTLVTSLGEDLSEQDHAEEALRRSEERYRNLFEQMPVGLYRALPDGTITDANPTLMEMLRCDAREEIVGRSALEFYVEAADRERFLATLREKETVKNFEVEVRRRDGTRFWVRNNAQAACDETGRLVEFEGAIEDITERREAEKRLRDHEARLRKLATELARAEEATRRRIAGEVHDFILQNLIGVKVKLHVINADMLDEVDRAELSEARHLVHAAVDDIRTLTFQLSPPVLYDLGLEPALAWLAREVGRRHGLAVAFEDDAERKPLSHDTRALLFRAARELLTNVVKHAQARRAVLTIRRVNRRVEVTVADDGLGADRARLEGLGDAAGGFGLFSIREHIEPLGGTVAFETETDGGTRVTVSVPVEADVEGASRSRGDDA
jgi:PAS domain S-box-containing protein